MTFEGWLPLGFEGASSTTYNALHDGVPDWMSESFWGWMWDRFTHAQRAEYSMEYDYFLKAELVRQVERRCRIAIPYRGADPSTGMALIRKAAEAAGAELRLADYLLSLQKGSYIGDALEIILEESGSAWKVGKRAGSTGLVRRVPEAVQSVVDHTIASGGRAGQRLAEAWEAAFGIDPDPSRAYALAVKSVEDAAVPVVSPNDTAATLGKINSQIRNTGGWSLPLQREDEHATTASTVLSMMKMLWAGQADRHGGSPTPEVAITKEAAEVAVMTAATLVQWFTSGAMARR
ncbi:hypothetical protein IWX65_002696 [Arthrobacter sp. CAN_A214]|uniref:hypothetical protein n=1 Tax=Arthrobacter sp. CAN_A214 TaxID=2787720 RepID=UPI0018CB3A2D